MLKIVTSVEPWLIAVLQSIFDETAESHDNDYESVTRFLHQDGGMICLWKDGEVYTSTCRVDMGEDACLLHNLATKVSFRRKNYGRKLVTALIEYLSGLNVSSILVHIKKDNIPSLKLHESVGFIKIRDSARLLDGTVTSAYITMEYVINEKTREGRRATVRYRF